MKTTDRPRGRPLKAPGTRRDITLQITFRPDEKEALFAAAAAAHLPFSSWARQILLPHATGSQEVAP